MNKKQLIKQAAEKSGLSTEQTAKLLDALLSVAADELADGGFVLLTGFGRLEAVTKKARKGVHPRTGEPIEIPAQKTAAFRPSAALLEKLSASDNDL